MNYIDIYKSDTTNGIGVRVVLWLTGCSHRCESCHNPQTWDPCAGKLFDEAAKQELFDALSKTYIRGITLSGGDPLFINNREEVLSLIKEIKEKFPQKDIWIYTGYTWENIFDLKSNEKNMNICREIMSYIDVLIDGPFVLKLKDLRLKWRGSSNQRVIDVPNSLLSRKIIEV